jgi:hypothetical protein
MLVCCREQSLFFIIMVAVYSSKLNTNNLDDHNPNTPHHNNLKNCVSVFVD